MEPKYNFCFLCFSNLTPTPPLEVEVKNKRLRKTIKADLVNQKRSSHSHSIKYLVNYLLQTSTQNYDEIQKDVLKLAGVRGSDDGGNGGSKKRRRCSNILKLCERCEIVSGKILDLHLELERVEMVIVNEVRTVRETILRSSGWLGGSGGGGGTESDLEEVFGNFSRRFGTGAGGATEKMVFEVLKGFQTAVSETAVHMKTHTDTEKRFSCDQCPQSFRYRDTFQTHQIREHGAPKLKCELCEKELSSVGGLQQHIVLEHGAAKICPICGTKCYSEHKLANHMLKHSDQKNYVCEECGKSFHTKLRYKEHKQIHGPRNFQCSYCIKSFTKKIYLIEHTRTHTGEKPFVCDGCGKAFSQKGPLNNHKKGCQLSLS